MQMQEPIMLKTTYGIVNGRFSSSKFCLFYPMKGTKTEPFLNAAAKDGIDGLSVVGSPSMTPGIPGCDPNIVGRMGIATYALPPGAIVKVFLTLRNKGRMDLIVNLLLQADESAPYIAAKFKAAEQAAHTYAIEGRLRRISIERARGAGIIVPPQFESSYSPEIVDKLLLQWNEILPGKEKAVVAQPVALTNEAGKQVEVVVERRRRAI